MHPHREEDHPDQYPGWTVPTQERYLPVGKRTLPTSHTPRTRPASSLRDFTTFAKVTIASLGARGRPNYSCDVSAPTLKRS